MTPSNGCSRTSSRKTSARALAAALAVLALATLSAPAAVAQALDLEARREPEGAVVDLAFHWQREQELLLTLADGLESRITFTIRLLERRPGLAGLLGDIRLAERTVTRVAFFDLLERRYVVEEAGETRAYREQEEFIAAYLSLRGLWLRGSLPGPPRSVSVAARVSFDPVRLNPPLTIVALAGAAATHTTPWVSRELPVIAGAP